MSDLIAELQAKTAEMVAQAKEPLARRIAELEAENERLKVCGTCHMWKPVPDADDTYCCTCIIIGSDPAYPHSGCDRWAERSGRR